MDVLNKLICLTLNNAWQPVGQKTVKDAICSIMGSDSYKGVNIEYEVDSHNKPIFDKVITMDPLSWDEWIGLPIREWDVTISSPTITIRVPTVLVATRFKYMPRLNRKMSSTTLWDRDSGTCQYTGKKLSRTDGNVDHVVPRSRGGKDIWTNLVICDKDINTMKADKLPHEAGLKLIRTPTDPGPTLLSNTIRKVYHTDWSHFVL